MSARVRRVLPRIPVQHIHQLPSYLVAEVIAQLVHLHFLLNFRTVCRRWKVIHDGRGSKSVRRVSLSGHTCSIFLDQRAFRCVTAYVNVNWLDMSGTEIPVETVVPVGNSPSYADAVRSDRLHPLPSGRQHSAGSQRANFASFWMAFPHLFVVDYSFTDISDDDILKLLHNAPNLRSLLLNTCPRISTALFAKIVSTQHAHLRQLSLHGTISQIHFFHNNAENISTIRTFLDQMPQIKLFDISPKTDPMSEEQLRQLRTEYPLVALRAVPASISSFQEQVWLLDVKRGAAGPNIAIMDTALGRTSAKRTLLTHLLVSEQQDKARWLLEGAYGSPNVMVDDATVYPLNTAIKIGNIDTVRWIQELGGLVNYFGRCLQPPRHPMVKEQFVLQPLACSIAEDKPEIAQYLIARGAKLSGRPYVDRLDRRSTSPLELCVLLGRPRLFDIILEATNAVERRHFLEQAPHWFAWACHNNMTSALEFIVANMRQELPALLQQKMQSRDFGLPKPLYETERFGTLKSMNMIHRGLAHAEITRVLLKLGADPNAPCIMSGRNGLLEVHHRPLDIAIQMGYHDSVMVLLESQAEYDLTSFVSCFHMEGRFQLLLDKTGKQLEDILRYRDAPTGNNMLHALSANTPFVDHSDRFLQHLCRLEPAWFARSLCERNLEGDTPLHVACLHSKYRLATVADPAIVVDTIAPPSDLAASIELLELAPSSSKLDSEQESQQDIPRLRLAFPVLLSHPAAAIAAGMRNRRGRLPLDCALFTGDLSKTHPFILKLIEITPVSAINEVADGIISTFQDAVWNLGHVNTSIIRHLLQRGANPNVPCPQLAGGNTLHVLVRQHRHMEAREPAHLTFRCLLEFGADPLFRNDRGETVFHVWAMRTSHKEHMITMMFKALSEPVDLNALDHLGHTMLYYVGVSHRDYDGLVRFLVKRGAEAE